MTNYLSDKLTILYTVLIIMVIYIHGTYLEIENYALVKFLQRFIGLGICHIANCLFFCLSGYMFAYSIKTEIDVIIKIKKRFSSLLMPYLLWNVIFVLWYVLLYIIPETEKWVNNYDIVKNVLCQPIWQTIYDLWWSPAAFHLWFLRDLLVMIAFTPLLWIWAQKHWFSAFLIALISTYFYGWLVYFWAGIFLAVKKLDIETYPHSIWIIISCTFLYIGYAVYVSIYETLPSYIEVFINFAGIYMIWSIYDLFVQGRCMARKGIWKWICGYSFFVYCFHEPTFNIIKKVFGTIGRQNEFALIFFYIFNPWIMMAVAIVVAKLLQYVLPSVYKVLTGGR